jgi:hypothetical protein
MTPEESLRFVLKMALRKSVRVVSGLRRHVNDRTEDVIVMKLLLELETAGWEIRQIPGRSVGFTFMPPLEDET